MNSPVDTASPPLRTTRTLSAGKAMLGGFRLVGGILGRGDLDGITEHYCDGGE